MHKCIHPCVSNSILLTNGVLEHKPRRLLLLEYGRQWMNESESEPVEIVAGDSSGRNIELFWEIPESKTGATVIRKYKVLHERQEGNSEIARMSCKPILISLCSFAYKFKQL